MTNENKSFYFRLPTRELVPNNVPDEAPAILSDDIRGKIDAWLLRYPPDQKRSGVLEALRLVQEANGGYLTVSLMDAVAAYLEIPKIAVYEVAAFYTMYHLNPVGRHVIHLCTNISCQLNGAEEIVEHVKARLGIDMNETTADGQFTLREVECLGACIAPPVGLINKQFYENITVERIDDLINELKG